MVASCWLFLYDLYYDTRIYDTSSCLAVNPKPHVRLKSLELSRTTRFFTNPLKPELNAICYLLTLLGAHHFLHVSRIRVESLTFR